jgi:hypothetical protein
VKPFVLHHSSVVFEQVHAQLQMVAIGYIFRHDVVVGAIEEEFAE